MKMATTNTPSAPQPPNPALKAYEEKVRAQVQEAKAKLEQVEAKAKEQKAETEITAINRLKTAKQNIDWKLQGLKTTQDEHLAHAKADIDQDVSKFKASIDTLSAKLRG
jgi:wobble nucleotide-excising tRNase